MKTEHQKVSFDPIKTSARLDGNSGKVRDIGVECIKQQIYDYVATNGLRELFERKIGTYQCASIPGRGQVYGKTAIENWIRKNPGKTRIAAKGDVRKCYPSINRRKLKRMLEKQVRNEDLLYLTFVLIDSFDQGLSIGSYLSQWLCNYYLSAAYHYAAEKLFKRKKHRGGKTEEIRLINHVLFYMDDFILIGSRKADVRKAMKLLVKYMNEYLDLTVKPDWKLFQIDWIDKEGKHHGEPIDMMGFKIYRDHTEVRRSKMFKNCVFKPSVDTVKWWKKAGIRAVKTMAQTAVGVIGAGSVISAVDWKMVVSSAVVAGVVSLLTSVAGIPEVEADENLFSDGTK